MFVALSLVISLLPTIPGTIFRFGGFPLLLGGLLIGPRTGFAVGCLTDLISFAMRPPGPFFPGFTLTQGLTCMIPALIMMGRDPLTGLRLGMEIPPDADSESFGPPKLGGFLAYFRLFTVFGITQLVTSVLMVSYFRVYLFGTVWQLEILERAFAQAVHVPIYAFLALGILKSLSENELYERLLKARR